MAENIRINGMPLDYINRYAFEAGELARAHWPGGNAPPSIECELPEIRQLASMFYRSLARYADALSMHGVQGIEGAAEPMTDDDCEDEGDDWTV